MNHVSVIAYRAMHAGPSLQIEEMISVRQCAVIEVERQVRHIVAPQALSGDIVWVAVERLHALLVRRTAHVGLQKRINLFDRAAPPRRDAVQIGRAYSVGARYLLQSALHDFFNPSGAAGIADADQQAIGKALLRIAL